MTNKQKSKEQNKNQSLINIVVEYTGKLRQFDGNWEATGGSVFSFFYHLR